MSDRELDKIALAVARVLLCMVMTGWAARIFATAEPVPLESFCALAWAALMLLGAFAVLLKGMRG